jgi:hypothetical protein
VKSPPSRPHSNVEAGSLEVKVNSALVLRVGLGGPEPIVVSGGVVSPGSSGSPSQRIP